MRVPSIRMRQSGDTPKKGGEYVLYWMRAFHRPRYNYALQRASELATESGLPLLILETLEWRGKWQTDRRLAFGTQGLEANAEYFAKQQVTHYPYVERTPGQALELAALLAQQAAQVLVDDHPDAQAPLPFACELVDSNGLLPLAATSQAYPTAYLFRRFLQNNLASHLLDWPEEEPLTKASLPQFLSLPREVLQKFPPGTGAPLQELPLDFGVKATFQSGGYRAAKFELSLFVHARLPFYEAKRNHPDLEMTSGLSPYLAGGQLSTHEVLAAIGQAESWSSTRLPGKGKGAKAGWWGMSASAEAFLDELVTWREVGFNMAYHRKDYKEYKALPGWALKTLEGHSQDERPYLYDFETLLGARTHDRVWNAAQRQLVREGRIHNYLRMLWGKKILEWSPTPEVAHEVMIELNNRYALDGCDPNSYTGIMWVLGRYDRPWPERPIFGVIRYMSSDNTLRKVRCREYIKRFED